MKEFKFKGPSIFEIVENKTFEEVKEIVTCAPYNLRIDETEKYYLLKYSLINSDMDYLACNQSRGIIFRKDNNKLVCYPFDKFWNHGESRAAKIDWSTAVVQEKIDGSLIKIWKDEGEIHISTNGKINAEDAFTQDRRYNFKELVLMAINYSTLESLFFCEGSAIDNITYLFELTTPYNRVVVDHKVFRLRSIGVRDNVSRKEFGSSSGLDKALNYNKIMNRLMSLDEIKEAAVTMSFDQEGFVVCDANFNRIKIKSHGYLAVHKIKGNGIVNEISVLDLVRKNDHREFLLYFPEYQEKFNEIKDLYYNWKSDVLSSLSKAVDKFDLSQKEFAVWAKNEIYSPFLFKAYKRQGVSFNKWIEEVKTKKLLSLIKGEKNEKK